MRFLRGPAVALLIRPAGAGAQSLWGGITAVEAREQETILLHFRPLAVRGSEGSTAPLSKVSGRIQLMIPMLYLPSISRPTPRPARPGTGRPAMSRSPPLIECMAPFLGSGDSTPCGTSQGLERKLSARSMPPLRSTGRRVLQAIRRLERPQVARHTHHAGRRTGLSLNMRIPTISRSLQENQGPWIATERPRTDHNELRALAIGGIKPAKRPQMAHEISGYVPSKPGRPTPNWEDLTCSGYPSRR
jgi:hypothetical protein